MDETGADWDHLACARATTQFARSATRLARKLGLGGGEPAFESILFVQDAGMRVSASRGRNSILSDGSSTSTRSRRRVAWQSSRLEADRPVSWSRKENGGEASHSPAAPFACLDVWPSVGLSPPSCAARGPATGPPPSAGTPPRSGPRSSAAVYRTRHAHQARTSIAGRSRPRHCIGDRISWLGRELASLYLGDHAGAANCRSRGGR